MNRKNAQILIQILVKSWKQGHPFWKRINIASFITDLINLNLIENIKTPNGSSDSFYITRVPEKNSELDIDPKNTFIALMNIETSSTNEIRQSFY